MRIIFLPDLVSGDGLSPNSNRTSVSDQANLLWADTLTARLGLDPLQCPFQKDASIFFHCRIPGTVYTPFSPWFVYGCLYDKHIPYRTEVYFTDDLICVPLQGSTLISVAEFGIVFLALVAETIMGMSSLFLFSTSSHIVPLFKLQIAETRGLLYTMECFCLMTTATTYLVLTSFCFKFMFVIKELYLTPSFRCNIMF